MQSTGSTLLRFFVLYLIVEVVIFGAVAVIGLISGWNTTTEYCNGLFLVGAVVIVLGLARAHGVNAAERDFKVQYAATVGSEGSANRIRRMAQESALGFGTSARMALYGITPIIVSIIILAVFGW
jgi:hypothetical protein